MRYKQVEEVLGQIFEIDPDDVKTFRARLRHLRNTGIPTDLPRPGSGAQISYTRDHVVELLIALELTSLGIAPRHTANLTSILKLMEFLSFTNDLYLIVYAHDNDFDFQVNSLADEDIIKQVKDHHRVSLVQLSSSLRVLDKYFYKSESTASGGVPPARSEPQ